MNTINLKVIKEMESINLSVQTVQAIFNYLAVQPYINAQPSKEEIEDKPE